MVEGVLHEAGSSDRALSADGIDARIGDLNRWIEKAGPALASFFVDTNGVSGFVRDSLADEEVATATSTSRSIIALNEYLRVAAEEGLEIPDDITQKQRAAATWWVFDLDTNLDEARGKSDNNENTFTDSHILAAAAAASNLARNVDYQLEPARAKAIRKASDGLARLLSKHLLKWKGGKVHDKDPAPHDFITLHAVRALDAHDHQRRPDGSIFKDAIKDRVEETVLSQLGYHSARVLAQYDPSMLVFSATLLDRFRIADAEPLTDRAVHTVVEMQTEDGAWTSSRILAPRQSGLLFIASYELALTLASLLQRQMARGRYDLAWPIVGSLEKVTRLISAGYDSGRGYQGWANDRARAPDLVESWATAIVLTLLVRYRDVLIALREKRILDRYRADPRPAPLRHEAWPDMHYGLRDSARLNEEAIAWISDPTPKGELVKRLRSEVLQPVVDSPIARPHAAGLILHGDPGTRKTSMVKQMARSLDWPLVTLSPPDFLGNGGLDGFEQAAAGIFRDLQRLRRAVVLFDECEDFFKPRKPKPRKPKPREDQNAAADEGDDETGRTESRTIGAFLTAGMLPRFQALRDARWVIFVLATNSGLEDLDSAVIRPGRFDFQEDVRHPVREAQVRYVRGIKKLTTAQQSRLVDAIDAVDASGPTRDECVSFGILQVVIDHLIATKETPGKRALRKRLDDLRTSVGPPALYQWQERPGQARARLPRRTSG